MKPILLTLFLSTWSYSVSSQPPLPYSVDATHLTVWNGESYVPLFIKGVNLGVGVPGTFPGEMAASRSQYQAWFAQMRDAGFNTIRV
jgi:hypothetical protein